MRRKKFKMLLVTIFTVWFIISAIILAIAFSIQNESVALVGGMLIGGWVVNFIRVLLGGYFYD